jgi:hypothetical protein
VRSLPAVTSGYDVIAWASTPGRTLRPHSHVRCVRLCPSDLVTSTAVVRPCPSDPPRSDRYGRVLCRNRAGFLVALSYLLSYHFFMAQRQKRSISLPTDLADAIRARLTIETI